MKPWTVLFGVGCAWSVASAVAGTWWLAGVGVAFMVAAELVDPTPDEPALDAEPAEA